MRLDSVLYKYEILSQVCYIQRYLSSANCHVSGVYCTEPCHLHSKMNTQVLCSMFFLHVLPECCAAALLTKARRQVRGGIMVLLIRLWFLKVLVRIKGMMYTMPAGSQI